MIYNKCRDLYLEVWPTFEKKFNFFIIFEPEYNVDMAFIFHMKCALLVTRRFTTYMYHDLWPSDLDLEVWPTFEKL